MAKEFDFSLVNPEIDYGNTVYDRGISGFMSSVLTFAIQTAPFEWMKQSLKAKKQELDRQAWEQLMTWEAEKFLNKPVPPDDGKWKYVEYTYADEFGGLERAQRYLPNTSLEDLTKVRREFSFCYHGISLSIQQDSSSMCHQSALIEDLEHVEAIRKNSYLKEIMLHLLDPLRGLN